MKVPIAFMGPSIQARTYAREIDSVDIGPTLAAILGVRPGERVDGKVLPEISGGLPR